MPERTVQYIQRPMLLFPEQHSLSKLDPVLQSILLNRGLRDEQDFESDLSLLLPWSKLKGIAQACKLLFDALQSQNKIIIVGDFDADGATSTALAMRALKAFGFERLSYLVPDRFKLGYGLSPAVVDLAYAQQAELIITVDNGISSNEGIAYARQLGIEVLVTDHHLPGNEIPQASAIVNPNQPGCDFESKYLAGVGVMFYLLIAFRFFLREKNFFQNRVEPNLAQWLDLVALGTVADLVPLDTNNRRLVQQGLARIRAGQGCAGIKALIEVSKKNETSLKSSDIGFALGPRINAAGRLDTMSLGIECLLCDDRQSALSMAYALNDFNEDRKQIEMGMKQEALALLPENPKKKSQDVLICLYDQRWHQGVVGIVASRLKEMYHLPAVIFAQDDENPHLLKGSARSVSGLHMRDALDGVASQAPQVLKKFGGHAMAAGMTIEKKDFEIFYELLEASIERLLGDEKENLLQAKALLDSPLSEHHLSLQFAKQLHEFEPWGQQFPEPLFRGEFIIRQKKVIAEKHLKMSISMKGSDVVIDAIAFNVDKSLLNIQSELVELIYRLDINEYRGLQGVQLMIEEITPLIH